MPIESYRPFPTIQDRIAWESLRPETRKALLHAGEKYLGFHWPEMPATVFLEYARDGNRSHYEAIRNARMGALKALLFAECVEGKGRFWTISPTGSGPLARRASGACQRTCTFKKPTWDCRIRAIPSSISSLLKLPLWSRPQSIFSTRASTPCLLNCARRYLRGGATHSRSMPCAELHVDGPSGGQSRHDLPWITLPEGRVQPVNNWDSWICWNWLTTILSLDRNPDRRFRGVQKVTVCLNKFINTYPDDGGCEEGPSYWNVASGAMFDGLELLHSATAGAIDIYGHPLISKMAMYLNRTRIAGDYYINQGDAPPVVQIDVDKVFRFAAQCVWTASKIVWRLMTTIS